MKKHSGYKVVPLTFNRRMVAVSASIAKERNTIHGITEVDITGPRRLILAHREKTGERLSFTAYIVHCFSRAVAENPYLNSFRKGGKIILLDNVTVSVLIERNIGGEKVPEPIGISEAQKKTYRQIHDEIRAAQNNDKDQLGSLSNMGWVRFIPGFLLHMFFRAASKNVYMQKRYGVVSVTAVGMYSKDPVWFIPLGGATVLITIGSINNKPVLIEDRLENREYLCLTVSFDHNIVDGAPAARFVSRLTELIRNGEVLKNEITDYRQDKVNE